MCFLRGVPSILRVGYAAHIRPEAAGAPPVEHVCLAADEFSIEPSLHGERLGPSLTVASRFRGCETELTILDGHRLAVRTLRPHGGERRYVLDLRFVDDRAVVERRIAWRWWLASLAGVVLAALLTWLVADAAMRAPDHALPVAVGLALLGVAIGVLAAYRTRESIRFRSVHGRADLVELVGGLGCSRALDRFRSQLSRHIAEARTQLVQPRPQFLRDELREHRRLLEARVLSAAAYEAGKQRILGEHG